MSKSRARRKKIESPIAGSAQPQTVAVIDIGASSIRMAVAEIYPGGKFRTLDNLIQPIDLGRDSFNHRQLSRRSIEKAVSILQKYRETLQQYGVDSIENVRVVATSAVREANNHLAFLDRVYVATGLQIDVMDEAEVNRITFMGVTPYLQMSPQLNRGKVVVFEIGGGNTELLVIRSGNVLHSESFRLGSVRSLETLELSRAALASRRGLLENHVRRSLDRIVDHIRTDSSIQMVALGGDIRFAGHCLLEDWDGVSLTQLPTDLLYSFTNEVLSLDEDEIVKRYGASFIDAHTLAPTLLIYSLLAKHFSLSQIHLCEANLRDGLLRDIASGGDWTNEFRDQTIRSARTLARRFDYDETYAKSVADLAQRLFVQMSDQHKLSSRFEVILYVAALLHEIGLFINAQSNHKHAFYIIRNSELFGLSKNEKTLVGLVARYHRRAHPQPSHEYYRSLNRDDRVAVAKLAAILRLAIAMNETRTGRIREIQCEWESKRLIIHVPDVQDVSLERLAMRRESGLFQDIYGVPVLLRTMNR